MESCEHTEQILDSCYCDGVARCLPCQEKHDHLTIAMIVDWHKHRQKVAKDGKLTLSASHNVAHIAKALGPMAAVAEHRDHGEPDSPIEEKRVADLIIHSIWLAQVCGFNPGEVVARRIRNFGDGFYSQ